MADAAIREPDPIYDSIGDTGKWQLLVVLLISVSKFPVGWHQLSTVFIAPPAHYECVDPGNDTDACSEQCKRFQYDRSIFEETAVTEWDLICDKYHYTNYGQTIFMFGILVGNVSYGVWADKRGRRTPLLFCVVIQLVAGCLAAIAPWYWLFVLLRFVCATAVGGMMLITFCILMEIIGPGRREFFHGILFQIPFNMGHFLLAPIAYFIRHFRVYQFVLSILTIVLLSYFCFMPESPRWLLLAKRANEAVAILERAARVNKLPTENIRHNCEEAIRLRSLKPPIVKGRISDLLKTPNLRKYTLCILFNWYAVGFNYFGVSAYIGQLSGNIFLNVAISGMFSVPGVIVSVPACKYLGRKPTLILSNFCVAFGMFCFIFLPEGNVQVFFASLGVFGAAVSFPTCYLYAGEIFPTSARNSGMGVSSMLARMGAMSAANASSFQEIAEWLPPLIFGGIAAIAMFLTLLLPETLGRPLPETAEEAENYKNR